MMLSVIDTLYSKCDQAFNLWQQLESTFELEFELQDTEDCWLEMVC